MNRKGFTLVELIIIISIVGILSIVIIPRIEIGTFKEAADIDSFISNIRYAQHKSMVTGNKWRFKIINSHYYKIDNDSNDSNKLPQLPAGNNPVKVETSISSSGENEIYFDYLGRPLKSNNQLITNQTIITINSKNIVIEPYSGGVYEQ